MDPGLNRRVAIVGGGPTGFAIARTMSSDPSQYQIKIFEKQNSPGGVWNYTGSGPVYQNLNTNITKELMEYTAYPFPESLPMYPDRKDVQLYIEGYSRNVARDPHVSVSYNRMVTQITKKRIEGAGCGESWTVRTVRAPPVNHAIETCRLEEQEEVFDFVVVASGHFDVPFIPPSIQGLRRYFKAHPERAMHTRTYDNPRKFTKSKVLVVGNGSSGTDVIIQIRSVTNIPITVSRRHESKSDSIFEPDFDVYWKPEISSVSEGTGEITFVDGSREVYDHIILATGYTYPLPFLEDYSSSRKDIPLIDKRGLRVQNLHKYMFYIGDPTLAFAGLNKNAVPMPLAECQGSVISRVFGGRLMLPSTETMLSEELALVEKKGSEQGYFSLGFPHDSAYMHKLNKWAALAPEGFLAESWEHRKIKLRERVGDDKLSDYKKKLVEARRRAKVLNTRCHL